MKPLKLVLRNIGPFINETIDFTKLDDIFLITGNTGAGKTFIFDAMTYALYGELKGNRSGRIKSIKSRYADESETEFFVEFTFQIAEKIYKVNRTVPFVKPGNTTETGQIISFWKKGINDEEFESIGTSKKTAGINSKIEEVIGLTADEFSKIVLLPQGAFAEFLKQNSNERGKTLEKLFPVSDYKNLIEAVEKKKTALEKKEADLNSKLEGELTSLKESNLDFENADSNISKLEDEIKLLEDKDTEFRKTAEKYSKESSDREHDLEDAREKERNEEKKKQLEDKKKDITSLSAKVEKAEKANALKEFINLKNSAENSVKDAEEEKQTAEKNYIESKNAFDRLDAEKTEMEKLNEENASCKTLLDSLKEKLSKKDEYEQSIKDEKTAKLEKEKSENEKKSLEDSEAELIKPLNERKIEDCISENQTEVVNCLNEKNICKAKLEQAEKRDLLVKDKEKEEKNRKENDKKLSEAKDKADRSENSLNQIRKEFEEFKVKNSAYYISKFLKQGDACPVCGSKEHPSPAENPEGLLNPEEIVKLYENGFINAKNAYDDLVKAAAQIDAKIKAVDNILETYKDLASTEEITKQFSEAEQAYDNAVSKKKELTSLQSQLSSLQDKINAASEKVHEKEIAYTAASAKKDALKKELGKNIDNLQSDYDQLKEKYSKNVSAYNLWNSNIADARENLSAALTARDEKDNQLKKYKKESADAEKKLSSELEKSIFEKISEAEKAMMDLKELADNRKICQEYFAEVKSVSDALKASRKLKSSEEINADIEKLNTAIEENKKAWDFNLEELKAKRDMLTLYKKSYQKIKNIMHELKDVNKESEPCKKLFKDLSGDNSKALRFDTWALGMYFDQIVEFASERFFEISDHRFEFTYKDIDEKTGKGGKAFRGLDLMVVDHNTPDKGPTDTSDLSGGETFEASISLALAVTDVVQNNNGGITLDSLFIDEGFGTLGPEPLETTMKILSELSETKMIGLISHVDSLQDSDGGITSQIQVEKTDHGSSISIK